LTVRNDHGITATFGYTFSRTIDNVSEIFGNNSGAGDESAYAQNPLDTNVGERGVSDISFPNAASIAFTYALPKVGSSDRGLVGRLANGWQMNSIWIYNSGQPFSDYDTVSNSSPQANLPIPAGASTAFPNGTVGDPKSYSSYSDSNFATNEVGFDTERPIVSNPKAPIGTVGIYTTVPTGNGSTNSAPTLVDYSTGAPVTPSAVHWIANNQYAAQFAGTPYPGSGRNLLRGDTFNNVDLNVYKNTMLTERVTLRIEADAYNVLNRSYYGLPDGNLGHYPFGTFNNFSGTFAQAGGLVGVGTGVRNMTFGAKLLF